MTSNSNTATNTTKTVAAQAYPNLQKTIEEIVDSGFVGVQLRVHDERGEWVGSAGAAELGETAKPPTNGHVRIGSNTKTFIATVVLQLVAEGKIGLDTPVADYLPEFGLDRRITVRMLLQHTSGVFNFTGEVYDDGTFVPGIPVPYGTAGKEWVDNRFKTYRPEELVRLALSKPARFEPGTDWSYSNTNYVLARLLIEKVTGRSLAEEMQRLILGPLGLSGTVVPDDLAGDPRAARPRLLPLRGRRPGEDGRRHPPEPLLDLQRRRHDLDHPGPAHVHLRADGRQAPAGPAAGRDAARPRAPKIGYGLGVFVQKTRRRRHRHHPQRRPRWATRR